MHSALFILIAGVGALLAQDTPGAASVPYQLSFKELKVFLTLSDEQSSQLQHLMQARALASRHVYEQANQKQRALNELMNAEAPDPAEVGKLTLELQNLRKQVGEGIHDRGDAKHVLTPEQMTKLATLEEAVKLRPIIDQAVAAGLIESQQIRPRISVTPVAGPAKSR